MLKGRRIKWGETRWHLAVEKFGIHHLPTDRNWLIWFRYHLGGSQLKMLTDQFILLAEDDPNDTLLIRRAFQKAGFGSLLKTVSDGQQAIDYLRGINEYSDRARFPLPFLLLLDLKMPGTNGFEVLQWIRSQADLRRLLVVVLTSSNFQADVDRAYESGANSYLVKPIEFNEMVNMIQRFEAYWTELNRFPTTTSSIKSPLAEKTLL